MREFIKSWKFMAIIIGLFTAIVVGLLVYGITTHTEPGLMQGTPGFSAQDVPITVCTVAYEGTDLEEAEAAVLSAMHTTNVRLGLSVFEVARPAGHCAIQVFMGVPSDHSAGGTIVEAGGAATFDNGSRRCAVTTTNTGTTEMLDLVLQHELGHCLGLDHDCWAGSIMCGGTCCTLAPTPDGSWPPRITDSDQSLLHHIFSGP